jgi:hypothetical protein
VQSGSGGLRHQDWRRPLLPCCALLPWPASATGCAWHRHREPRSLRSLAQAQAQAPADLAHRTEDLGDTDFNPAHAQLWQAEQLWQAASLTESVLHRRQRVLWVKDTKAVEQLLASLSFLPSLFSQTRCYGNPSLGSGWFSITPLCWELQPGDFNQDQQHCQEDPRSDQEDRAKGHPAHLTSRPGTFNFTDWWSLEGSTEGMTLTLLLLSGLPFQPRRPILAGKPCLPSFLTLLRT